MRFSFTQPVAVLLLIAGVGNAEAAPQDRPNIVLIMADDLGLEGLGCYGGTTYSTPVFDRLASQGMRFTMCFSS